MRVSRSRRFYPVLKVQDSRQVVEVDSITLDSKWTSYTGIIQPGLDSNSRYSMIRTFAGHSTIKKVWELMIEPWGMPQRVMISVLLSSPPVISCAGKHLNHFICETPLSGSQAVLFFFKTMLLPQHCWAGGYQQAGEELVEVGGGYFPKHKEPLSEDVMKGPNVSNRPKQ